MQNILQAILAALLICPGCSVLYFFATILSLESDLNGNVRRSLV